MVLLTVLPARGGAPLGEAELVRRFVQSDVVGAELRAGSLLARARATPAPNVANPELNARHEEVGGGAPRTDAIGGTVTIDLGFVGGANAQAARLAGQAVAPRTREALTARVCALRHGLTDLVAAEGRAAVIASAHERLNALNDGFTRLAEAGEIAPYDRDRAAMADTAHQVELASANGDAAALRIRVSAATGVAVDAVTLAPLEAPADQAQFIEQHLADHPQLLALRTELAASERAEVAARRQALPDLRVGGAARFDSRPGTGTPVAPGFEVSASIELPVVDRAQRAVREAAAARQQHAARLARQELELRSAMESAWERGAVARGLAEQVLDPEAIWDAARARYAGGAASIDDLLQTASDVEDAQLATLAARMLIRRADLDLQCAAGRFTDPAIQSAIDEALR